MQFNYKYDKVKMKYLNYFLLSSLSLLSVFIWISLYLREVLCGNKLWLSLMRSVHKCLCKS